MLSKTADIWILSQYANLKDGWTGFHHLTAANVPPYDYHQVAYLPSINSSPTKTSTVQEVLIQVKQKAEKLCLTEADLVLDHAIYSKALEILTNPVNKELRKYIVIRMGGFHTECTLIAVIGKRFKDALLKDAIVESGILGSSSAERALNGKEYNYDMHILKYIYVALWRLKMDSFEQW